MSSLMTRATAAHRRPGFSLLEMLAVLWVDVLVLGIGGAAIVATLKIEHAAAGSLQRVKTRGELADRFRADVGRAVACPDAAGGLKAGPGCLVLRTADGKHLAYRWEAGRLERAEPAGAGAVWRPVAAGPDCVAAEFVRGGDGRLVTLRLSESRGSPAVVRPVEIAAAVGGDVR